MNRQAIENVLSRSLKQSFRLEEKRNALYQVFVPIYHEDGDMMDIFIMSREDGSVSYALGKYDAASFRPQYSKNKGIASSKVW